MQSTSFELGANPNVGLTDIPIYIPWLLRIVQAGHSSFPKIMAHSLEKACVREIHLVRSNLTAFGRTSSLARTVKQNSWLMCRRQNAVTRVCEDERRNKPAEETTYVEDLYNKACDLSRNCSPRSTSVMMEAITQYTEKYTYIVLVPCVISI